MFKIVFSDFDGTLTYKEGLGPIFFDILTFLETQKAPLVIVTGRSLSWGHFLLTHFPYLNDVIVEGGGAIVSRRNGKFITEECLVSEDEVQRLTEFTSLLKNKFPSIALSVDSFGRKTDRAIELHDLQDGILFHHIEDFLREQKINFSTSNVHLNFWCGEVSKYKAVQHFLKLKNIAESECIFFGDSLNDQSMFKSFKHSVGVANISSVLDRLEFKPGVILEGSENVGPWGVLNHLKKHKLKILFLCTGNSCRSQMAEGWSRYFYGDKFDFYSAGIEKHGMNVRAIKVMQESGVDITSQTSKTLTELAPIHFDYVFTVCGHADKYCPPFSGQAKIIHVGFDDPPKLAEGLTDEEQILIHYRRVRDEICEFVKNLEINYL